VTDRKNRIQSKELKVSMRSSKAEKEKVKEYNQKN